MPLAHSGVGCSRRTLDDWQQIDISSKELVPIVMAAAAWDHRWRRCCIRFRSDMAVIEILGRRVALLRCLLFYSAFFRFDFTSEHIPGMLNTAADVISHNNLHVRTFVRNFLLATLDQIQF